MKFLGVLAVFAVSIAYPVSAVASAPDRSLRPLVRDTQASEPVQINQGSFEVAEAPTRSQRPLKRTGRAQRSAAEGQKVKKGGLFARLKRKKPAQRVENATGNRPRKGSVCGVNGIEGTNVEPVRSSVNGCGISDPVRISAVDGVSLVPSAVIDCPTAKALYSWVNGSVKPAIKRKGGGVKSLKVAAHYACRTRNNRKGARISEHGKGRAIDISAIHLNDGSSLTVLKDWRSRNSKIMRTIHAGACGPFGTVLGPQSDRYHQDHFHFDTARYRSGPYCR